MAQRKIHISPTGSKYIVKNGKKLYGAPMQKVLESEGQKLPKRATNGRKATPAKRATNGRKATPAKRATNGTKKPTAAQLQKRLDAANAKLRNARNASRQSPFAPVEVHPYYRSLPGQLTHHEQVANRRSRNPRTRGRMVYENPELETSEFIEVPAHLADAYELFQGKEVDECILIEAPDYFPDELWEIGEMPNIDYEAAKGHINGGELVHYTHKTGEEGGERPILCADEYGNLLMVGGDYTIHAEGIRN